MKTSRQVTNLVTVNFRNGSVGYMRKQFLTDVYGRTSTHFTWEVVRGEEVLEAQSQKPEGLERMLRNLSWSFLQDPFSGILSISVISPLGKWN